MIYRIFFQPDGAFWCIQFKSFFRWVTVKAPVKHDLEPVVTHQVVKFDTLAEAEEYCVDRGIDRAYHRAQTTTYVTAVLAGAKTEEQEMGELGVVRRFIHTDCSGQPKGAVSP